MRRVLPRPRAGRRKRLERACLTAILATAWGAAAPAGFEPFDVRGWVEPERPLQSAYLYVNYYTSGGSGCAHYAYLYPLGATVPANGRGEYSFTIQTGPADSFSGPHWRSNYSVIGVYDDEAGAVTLSYAPLTAASLIANGNEWEYFFGEVQVAVWLQTGDDAGIRSFFAAAADVCGTGAFAELGGAAPLVAYSHAVANGASYFEVACGGENGDANCDGAVDFFDIDPFLSALFDSTGYVEDRCNGGPCCSGRLCAADTNDDGRVDFFDIDPFLACLFAPPGCP